MRQGTRLIYRVTLTDEQREELRRRTHTPGLALRTHDRLEIVRLANVELDELEELLIEGWRCQAQEALVKEFDAHRPSSCGSRVNQELLPYHLHRFRFIPFRVDQFQPHAGAHPTAEELYTLGKAPARGREIGRA